MCGFVAAVDFVNGDASLSDRAFAGVRHRGPDSHRRQKLGFVDMGFHRLKILDLSDAADQPMTSDDGRFTLLFNGCIYNFEELKKELRGFGHAFRTSSDTEVVLAAYRQWGVDSFSRFNGMWAIAIVDSAERTVLLSRDRYGVKPLYAVYDGDALVAFGSDEAAALNASGMHYRLDMSAIADFVLDRRSENVLLSQVQQIEPRTVVRCSAMGTEVSRFNDDPDHPVLADADTEFQPVLLDAVRLRLKADVPVALTLSGGLDSTAIALACRLLGVEVECFTADFGGIQSETTWAEQNAKALGHPHHSVDCCLARHDVSLLESVIAAHGGPLSDPAALSLHLLLRDVHQRGFKVVLDGQGADETLGGYSRLFLPAGALDALAQKKMGEALQLFSGAVKADGLSSAVWNHLNLAAPGISQGLRAFRRYESTFASGSAFTTRPLDSQVASEGTGRVEALAHELQASLLPRLLRYGDRVSMVNGIEQRNPFLDYRLVNLASRFRREQLMSGSMTKLPIRTFLASGGYPLSFSQRKLGFPTDIGSWFQQSSKSGSWDRLLSGRLVDRGIIDPQALISFQHRRLTENRVRFLFRILSLEVYLENLGSEISIN